MGNTYLSSSTSDENSLKTNQYIVHAFTEWHIYYSLDTQYEIPFVDFKIKLIFQN